jgi:hypothetical protein
MCLEILKVINAVCSICCVHPRNWKGLSNELCMCVKEVHVLL